MAKIRITKSLWLHTNAIDCICFVHVKTVNDFICFIDVYVKRFNDTLKASHDCTQNMSANHIYQYIHRIYQ